MKLVFWLSFSLLMLPYVVYPGLVWLLARMRPRRTAAALITPSVSVIIAVHNEAESIVQKLRNTAALDYPPGRMEIILADDCSTDGTIDQARTAGIPGLKVVRSPVWEGKTHVQNLAVPAATGEILVFTDATAMLEPDAVKKMVAHFADPKVGCVTGNIRFNTTENTTIQRGLRTRRDYEVALRINQSLVWSTFGATGALYALRRSEYVELSNDAVSDFNEPLELLARGYRTIYEPKAWCYMDRPVESSREFGRRRRVVGRGLHGIFYGRRLLNPFRYPWPSFTLVGHRLARLAGPIWLTLLLVSSVFLAGRPFYGSLLAFQVMAYLLAGIGALSARSGRRIPFVHVPYFFALINLAALSGWWAVIRGERFLVWDDKRTRAPKGDR